MPPSIQKQSGKLQPLEMDAESLRENLSRHHLINESSTNSSANSEGEADEIPEVNTVQPRITRRQIITVVILCYVNLINYMDRYTVAGILGDIGDAFNLTESEKGLLQTAFILVYMVMAPIFGYLGDRINRKILMAIGVFIWSFTMLLGSFMTSYELFLLMRCFVGIGEASYSTIAPTVISDIFQGDRRSKMLALFYFAIPVGSGLGYIIGAEVTDLAQSLNPDDAANAWRWGLRVTPILGAIAFLLISFVLREPPRGESEGASNLKPTSFFADLRYLFTNKSYVLITLGFTCVTYMAGALAWWAPLYVELGAKLQDEPNVPPTDVSYIFGVVAMLAGLIGVPLGSFSGQRLRAKYSSGDALVCGVGLMLSIPFLVGAIYLAATNIILAFIVVLFGQIFLNLNWAVVSDMVLYICIPTRRSSAQAFQILIAHAFGDAGSPYIVGKVAEAFKPIINETHSDIIPANSTSNYLEFYSLQYSLTICTAVEALAAVFFLWTAFHIASDKAKCDRAITGDILVNECETQIPEPTHRYSHETDVETTKQLIT